MAAGRYDFTVEAGATWSRQLTWRDANGVLVPLVGLTARLHIRATQQSVTPALALTSPSGGIVLTSPGVIAITMTAAQTTQLGATLPKGVYDLELASGSGSTEVVARLLQGTVKISPEVTRA